MLVICRIFLCSSCVQGRQNRVTWYSACLCRIRRLTRAMVKAHVLSLQSRGRSQATCTMGRGHLVKVTGLHAADRSGTREQCPGRDRRDVPQRDDESSQKTGRGHSAGYASTDVSPSLCPGLPFIRSTRGTSYGDTRIDTNSFSLVASREPERASETRLELRSCSSSRTAQGAACKLRYTPHI